MSKCISFTKIRNYNVFLRLEETLHFFNLFSTIILFICNDVEMNKEMGNERNNFVVGEIIQL